MCIEWGLQVRVQKQRQLVSHKAIIVNDQVVNIASFLVKPGDIVSVRQKAREQARIQAAVGLSEQRAPCAWITVESATFKGTFVALPTLTDLPADFNVSLVC